MASREVRRIRERLAGKKEQPEGAGKKFNFYTIPTFFIIGLVLIGLLWWGYTDKSGTYASITFGFYDGVPIVWASGNYYARKTAEFMQINQLPVEDAIRLLFPYMVFHTAALREAQKGSITVSDKEVEEFIINTGNKERYNNAVPVERHNLFEYFREELIERKVLQAMLQSVDNNSLSDFGSTLARKEKSFRLVQWLFDDYPLQEVLAYTAENPKQFQRIKLSKLVANKEEEAKAAYEKIINKQSTFDEQLSVLAATQMEATASLDWKLFYLLADELGSETAQKIFALKKGEISEVVYLGTQWAIYRCDEEATAPDLSDKKTVDEIKNYILTYEKGRVATFFENQAKDFSTKAKADGLTKTALAQKMEVAETDFFPLNFNGLPFLKMIPPLSKGTGSLSDAQYERSFFTQAFRLKLGEVTEPIILNNRIIVLELAQEKELTAEELTRIKEDFKIFHQRYFGDFFFTIVDHLYLAGTPIFQSSGNYDEIPPYLYHQIVTSSSPEIRQFYLSQLVFNPYGIFPQGRRQDWPQLYLAFVDEEKAGSPSEQEERFNKGLEEFRKLYKKE